jgi:hypothetical protein
LARRNCSLYLVDVSQRLLEAAASKLRETKLDNRIKGMDRASATALDFFEPGKFDAALMLGAESFTGIWQNKIAEPPEAEAEAWLELVEATTATPEGLGASDHFLFIGKKRG